MKKIIEIRAAEGGDDSKLLEPLDITSIVKGTFVAVLQQA